MTESELSAAANLVRQIGAEKLLDRICDHTESYREGLGGGHERFRGGVKVDRAPVLDQLVKMRLVRLQRGKAVATAYGFSVSTRLCVLSSQARARAQGPHPFRR